VSNPTESVSPRRLAVDSGSTSVPERVRPENLQVTGDFNSWLETYFLGRHPRIREVRNSIIRAAAETWPVLITGETGTGKDMVARAIHTGSPRGRKAPEVVAVGGLGETTWSILFGHRKGSFTGAVEEHEGVFRSADRSSLLLEDIGDLPMKVQPMLLRALEHGVFRPLGSDREVHSDVRVIATSNLLLEHEVSEGRFRADLYQRLSVLKIDLPPLREHLDDLEIYVPHFLKKAVAAHRPDRRMSPGAMKVLFQWSWPRNIRELEHFLYRLSVEAETDVIREEEVRRALATDRPRRGRARRNGVTQTLNRAGLIRILEETGGNKREAARKLKISPGSLYSLMKEFKIFG